MAPAARYPMYTDARREASPIPRPSGEARAQPARRSTYTGARREGSLFLPFSDKAKAGGMKGRAEAAAGEPLPDLHSATGRDVADDGRRGARRRRGVPAAAGFGAAAGRLPDYPDPDLLSGREPGGDDVFGHRAAREAVRAGAWPDADDVDQFLRQFADHAAVLARSQHRYRRAGSAGGHQRGVDLSAQGSPVSSDLQQDESGRRADSDARDHLRRRCRCPRSKNWRKRAWRREFRSSRAWAW